MELTKEQYISIKSAWKILANNKAITPSDVVLHNILRNKPLDTGFIPKKSNIQGNDPLFAFNTAKWYAIKKAKNINHIGWLKDSGIEQINA